MMDSALSFMTDYFVADVCIGLVGLFAAYLVLDRVKALYFDYALPAEPFMKQVLTLLNDDKIEEAITFCAANQKKPLAYIIKAVLERADRDERSMEQALDIASSETAPRLVKNLGYLSMVSNVVTLIGLFGTVIGLIVAFKAISFADVSQKQTILAQGISIAMTATAMGLVVAIPTMFIYSFLHAKQSRLFSEIDEYTTKVMDVIRNRSYEPMKVHTNYPTALNADRVPRGPVPPPVPGSSTSKAS